MRRMNEEKKRVYHVELDVVDDTGRFVEETEDKSEDLDVLPEYVMLTHIKKGISGFNRTIELVGVYVTNVKVTIPMYGEEKD